MSQQLAIDIVPARSMQDFTCVLDLVAEYAHWLGRDLSFTGLEDGPDALRLNYTLPQAAMFIAYQPDGAAAGCCGFAPLKGTASCELKRLFVRPEARGLGVGRNLLFAVIETATSSGYEDMVLDTLPSLWPAIQLYHDLGFRSTEPYHYNPYSEAIFFRKPLNPPLTTGSAPSGEGLDGLIL